MDCLGVFDIIRSDAVAIISEDGFKEKLQSGKKLRIKLGADPSRPDLHLGHSVVLRKLRLLQELGHEIVFVIGDFTGMIGDPSGKSKTRKPLTFEQTRENGKSYFEQVVKILDKDKTIITYNSEWLSKMNFGDVLNLAGKYTVAQIMERDDFAKRFSENESIGMHELFYPLMQGYDSVALNADVEVGGTDQTFNLLVGRELQRDFGQEPQSIITFPLLPGLDGIEKMSKSLDNYIGINESPAIMFEKCMKVPDSILEEYFHLTTDIDEGCYKSLLESNIQEAHFLYASEIVTIYWGREFSTDARKRYIEVAKGGLPETMDKITIDDSSISIIDLVRKVGFAKSNSEARRLVQGNGIKINNEVVKSIDLFVDSKSDFILSKGKNKFVKICFEN